MDVTKRTPQRTFLYFSFHRCHQTANLQLASAHLKDSTERTLRTRENHAGR
jgi:hypothetical protein